MIDVQFSPDNQTVATASSDGSVRLWDVSTGDQEAVFNVPDNDSSNIKVNRIDFSPSKVLLAAAYEDGSVRLWQSGKEKPVAELFGHAGPVLDVEFAPDGTRLITASEDGTARLWDIALRGTVAVLKGHTDKVRTAQFNSTGTQVITASNARTARVWRVFRDTKSLLDEALADTQSTGNSKEE